MQSIERQSSSRVLRAKEAATFLTIGESTFWRWVKEGRLPQGIRLSARCTVWMRESLEIFLAQQAIRQRGASC